MGGVQGLGFRVWGRFGFYGHNRDIDPRNQRALTLLGLLLECSLILFILVRNPSLVWGGRVKGLGFESVGLGV